MTPYYENHPVRPERKQELTRKGYKIIDARFAPAGWQDPEAPKRRSRKVDDEE